MPTEQVLKQYAAPAVTYHGTLQDLTQAHHLVVAGQVVRFAAAFANSIGPPPHRPDDPVTHEIVTTAGDKALPFTGLYVMGVAGVGAALVSGGAVLRRVVRRRSDASN